MPPQIRARRAASAPIIPFPKRKAARALAASELSLLEERYPQTKTALDYGTPFELLVAVILSAQTTDARVNVVTPELFARFPTPRALGEAALEDVEPIVRSCGFRSKAAKIVGAARAIALEHGGEVPRDRDALEALPGVGRKTASVVLSVAFEDAAFAVDTHVYRVSRRLGLSTGATPRAVEDDVVALLPAEKWRHAHHWLIRHGREICRAPVPLCGACFERELCPSAPIVAKALARRAAPKARRPPPPAPIREKA